MQNLLTARLDGMISTQFEDYIQEIYHNNLHKRIIHFDFEGKGYWLKSVEFLTTLSEKIMKPCPKKAFKRELSRLLELQNKVSNVPQVVYYCDEYFVTADHGTAISQLINSGIDRQEQQKYLCMVAKQLAQLHRQDIIHGRPAIRDILYDGKNIYFIDFESFFFIHSLRMRKTRDFLIFIHSLLRNKHIDPSLLPVVVQTYREEIDPDTWQYISKRISQLLYTYPIINLCKKYIGKDGQAYYKLLAFFKNQELSFDKRG
ncbi:BUD32 family EKC/KEOPS complex subunit [Basilea psittacipulmonis]|uniref:Protein kinase domain-containing protein n=1 Tax=Basilea psittacipulmonis DSM 24701 TaxID=1072685 RepID=A0A077DH47_9BURK|nr:hypothetical protein [Basilea psittacipulmonis]AIL32752.1 hypothetical protein IX83_05015 [Basilea psittacipulmonis DSM 24701]